MRNKHASAERTIRFQHDFEDKLRDFLSLAAALTDKELEIALGRLADMVGSDKAKAQSNQVKGLVLHIYYQFRLAGLKKRSRLARATHWITPALYTGAYGEYLITKLSSFQLPSDSNEDSTAVKSDDAFKAQVKLLAP